MISEFPYREDALNGPLNMTDEWINLTEETYIKDAGWYFKTLAVQEIGEIILICLALGRHSKLD